MVHKVDVRNSASYRAIVQHAPSSGCRWLSRRSNFEGAQSQQSRASRDSRHYHFAQEDTGREDLYGGRSSCFPPRTRHWAINPGILMSELSELQEIVRSGVIGASWVLGKEWHSLMLLMDAPAYAVHMTLARGMDDADDDQVQQLIELLDENAKLAGECADVLTGYLRNEATPKTQIEESRKEL
jgi:hypothetical protein